MVPDTQSLYLDKQGSSSFTGTEKIIVLVLMLAAIVFQLFLRYYGFHSDELYYMAIGDNWSFSNLDTLPLTPLYLRIFTFLFGHSMLAIHLASSICCAFILLMICLITKELGGKKYAILLSGLFLFFGGLITVATVFTYDNPGHLIWLTALYWVIHALKENNPQHLIIAGLFIGIGMLNKVTILFLPFALVISLPFVSQRIWFMSRWLWIAGCIIIPLVLPYLLWQYHHDWYFLDFVTKYTDEMSYKAAFPAFLWNQIIPNNILTFPVWLMALILLLFSSKWKTYRLIAFSYIFLFIFFYILHSPFYFLMPLYAILISVGSIRLEELMYSLNPGKLIVKFGRAVLPLVYILGSIPLLPLAVPILPVERLVRYTAKIGVDLGIKTNSSIQGLLPTWFADRFGWEDMVKEISTVYHLNSEIGKTGVGIITGNYGEASAVHFYHKKYDLPDAISTHGWYYYHTIQVHEFKLAYVSIGVSVDFLLEMFLKVEQKGKFFNPYCNPNENNQIVYLCTGPKVDLKKRWLIENHMNPQFKEYIEKEGVFKAIDHFHTLKKSDTTTLLFTEKQINTLGYEYLRKGKTEESIALFALNVEENHESFNVYDSLGEAYFVKGEFELASKYYKEALRRNPANKNSEEYLSRIQKKMIPDI